LVFNLAVDVQKTEPGFYCTGVTIRDAVVAMPEEETLTEEKMLADPDAAG
jgi:hypothetical protein